MYLEAITERITSQEQVSRVIDTVSPAHGEMLRDLAQRSGHWQRVLQMMESPSSADFPDEPLHYVNLAFTDFCYAVREHGTEEEYQALLSAISAAVDSTHCCE